MTHAGLDCHDGNLANRWRLGGVSKGTGTIPKVVNGGMGGLASAHLHRLHRLETPNSAATLFGVSTAVSPYTVQHQFFNATFQEEPALLEARNGWRRHGTTMASIPVRTE